MRITMDENIFNEIEATGGDRRLDGAALLNA
jgi:hypothetical protein